MTVYLIYKQTLNDDGDFDQVELVECDSNETNAQRFSKLYTLQVPRDMKNKISYNYIATKVI